MLVVAIAFCSEQEYFSFVLLTPSSVLLEAIYSCLKLITLRWSYYHIHFINQYYFKGYIFI